MDSCSSNFFRLTWKFRRNYLKTCHQSAFDVHSWVLSRKTSTISTYFTRHFNLVISVNFLCCCFHCSWVILMEIYFWKVDFCVGYLLTYLSSPVPEFVYGVDFRMRTLEQWYKKQIMCKWNEPNFSICKKISTNK